MAEGNVDIRIEADPATGEGGASRVPAEVGVEDLKRQVAAQREESARLAREKEEAQRAAAQKGQQVAQLQNAQVENQYQIIAGAITSTQQESNQLKRDLREAMERGDYEVAADLQEKMGDVRARLMTLQQGRDHLEGQRRQQEAQQRAIAEGRQNAQQQPGQQVAAQQDPVQAYLNQFTPRTRKWLTDNPTIIQDRRLNMLATAAHHEALANDYVPDTDAYFQYVEQKLGLRDDGPARQEAGGRNAEAATVTVGNDPAPSTAVVQAQRRPPVAAPVSRDATSLTTGRGQREQTTITLTPAHIEAARISGMSNEEYAAALLKERQAGRVA